MYSFVKSLTFDTWTDFNLLLMENGGNGRALVFIRKNGLLRKPQGILYKSPLLANYKKQLKKLVKSILKKRNPEPEVEELAASMPLAAKKPVLAKPEETKDESPTTKEPFATQEKPKPKPKQKAAINFNVMFNDDPHSAEFSNKKRKVKAKRIANINFNDLTLDDNKPTAKEFTTKPKAEKNTMIEPQKNMMMPSMQKKEPTTNSGGYKPAKKS